MNAHSSYWNRYAVSFFLLLLLPLLLIADPAPSELPSLTLTQRQLCDLEMIMNGGFAPLNTFLNQKDYDSVVDSMRLADGTLWPVPVTLDIKGTDLEKIKEGGQIALKDQEGFILAVLNVAEIWSPNKEKEAEKVYGTTDTAHPGVDYLLNRTGSYYLSGQLNPIQAPLYFDFVDIRKNPEELKRYFKEKGIEKIAAFQTRTPMHRVHYELAAAAVKRSGVHLLIHPAIGQTKPGDVDYFTRVKCYKKVLPRFPEGSATLSLLPLAMRMAGPREALWHALIQKNYGCTHFIVGRDHGGGDRDKEGGSFYPTNAAQELVENFADEIGIVVIPFHEFVYVRDDDTFKPIEEVPSNQTILSLSGSDFRKLLHEGEEIPAWFTFPEVAEELKKVYPPRALQGFTLFFTGLSGAGKSTLAKGLAAKLTELQDRPVTMLDGDVIRNHLSAGLGFSKEHRSINVRRVGYVSSEITKNRGIAICAMIAPYAADRAFAREIISSGGNFIEIYVSTSFDACAERDTKGLYNLAKEGKLKGFTGLDDPYEVPENAEIVIDTTQCTIAEGVERILNYLRQIKHIP